MKKFEIEITGMKCGGCKSNVERELSEIDGIKDMKVSLEDKKASGEVPDNITENFLKDKIEKVGYQVVKIELK